MDWDDNWTRALVTVLAAAAGAIIAGLVNAYAANRKVREVELQYQYKLRDSYIENARSVASQVYIPISIALTQLSNAYDRYAVMIGAAQEQALLGDFEHACLTYLEFADDLVNRGADAYLTTSLDEKFNDFNSFIKGSINQSEIRKRRVIQTRVGIAGIWADGRIVTDTTGNSRGARARLPDLTLGMLGLRVALSEKLLAAPLASKEFEERLRTDVIEIKALIKEVTLGSTASALS